MIYLDYAANSPVDKNVLDVFYQTSLCYFANPNSSHKLGKEVQTIIDESTLHMLHYLHLTNHEIIYTSGASEANNLLIKGLCERYKSKGKHIIIGSFEHNSITVPCSYLQQKGFEVDVVPITKDGLVDFNEFKDLIHDDTILVSVSACDSELGIVQPIEEIAALLKEYPQCYFHTDASQAIGKVNIDYSQVDLITITPHKFYGVNGFGALIKKKEIGLIPLIHGGKSTTIYRSGTPVVAGIAAMDRALQIAIECFDERRTYVSQLQKKIIEELSKYSYIHINNTQYSHVYIINFSILNVPAKDFVKKLEDHHIYLSAKTSCCPDNTPSKLVFALTHNKALASSSIRLSLSHLTTKDEMNEFLRVFKQCYKEIFDGKI